VKIRAVEENRRRPKGPDGRAGSAQYDDVVHDSPQEFLRMAAVASSSGPPVAYERSG
jgi:hypothetical protein